jgi:hypothetical protein
MDQTERELLDGEVRKLRADINDVRSQMRSVLTVLTVLVVVPVPILVALSLWAGAYREVADRGAEVEDATLTSLASLPGQASEAGNVTVQVFAVLTIVAMVVVVVAALAMLGVRTAVPAAAATGALALLWIGLMIVVVLSGGGGYIGKLGVAAEAGAWWPAATALWTALGIWLVRHLRVGRT